MTRNTAREIATHLAYELSFTELSVKDFLDIRLSEESFAILAEEYELYETTPNAKQEQYIRTLVSGAFEHGPELDDYISRYSVGWSFARIPRVAAAIMRVAMYEVLYMPEIPIAAAINEAVEIAKNYETAEVVSFINGILGTFVRSEFPEETQ